MDIIISNANGEPIYEQIYSQIKAQIMNGTLQEGDALPSMRALAQQLRISVITTKRAYEELERDGFIESYTGKGSFVKARDIELFREEELRAIEGLITEACGRALRCGVSLEELKEITEMLYGGNENE
ncbi:MAG: GntR family transcriptional regulator [Ruminococcus sp.]|nr:GntR family transcriptional regulator [Ruminococcus sp.]MCR5141307.1 GntR family transcriptional regulator [Ruminococcus sp.]